MKYTTILLLALMGFASDACAMESKTAGAGSKLMTFNFKTKDQFALRAKAGQQLFFRNLIEVPIVVARTTLLKEQYNGHPLIQVNADIETVTALKQMIFQEDPAQEVALDKLMIDPRPVKLLEIKEGALSAMGRGSQRKLLDLISELGLENDRRVKRAVFDGLLRKRVGSIKTLGS